MPQNMTHLGVGSGKADVDAEGDSRVVYDGWTLSTYDPDSDGSGNDFNLRSWYGISRLKFANVYVADGSPYHAVYDHDAEAVRLYALDGTGEVGNSTEVNVDLRINVRGSG